jgi:flagellar basal body-associated protein FliL
MVKSLDIIDPKKELPKEEDRDQDLDEMKNNEPRSGVFYLILGIIAIIVASTFALYILFKDNKKSNDTSALTSSTATVSATVSATESSTPTTPTNPTVTAVSAFKYTNESIRVANGNKITGEGAKIKKLLEEKGFKVESVGNASKTYSESIVYYKSGQEKLAEALKEAIASEYKAKAELADKNILGSYDAVVVLGTK